MTKKYLRGLERTRRVFNQLPEKSLKSITRALNKGAQEIEARAKLLVPVDTGDLKQDIDIENRGVQIRSDNRAVVVRVVAGTTKANGQAAFRSEFGRNAGGGHPGHPAQPFMFPAYMSVRKKVRRSVKGAVTRAAKASAQRSR